MLDGREVERIGIPSNHVGMCKFETNQDIGYKRILHQIRSCLSDASRYEQSICLGHLSLRMAVQVERV